MTEEETLQITEDLKAPLGQALIEATARRARGEPVGKLHQAIVGPLTSGKTVAAHDYAQALAETGLVKNENIVDILYHEQLDRDEIEARFEAAKNGVIIIDDITRHIDDASVPHPLTGFMWRALAGAETTVILTGYKDKLEEFARTAPPEKQALLPKPVEMEKSFSFDERQAFTDVAGEHRKARQARRKISDEWGKAGGITAEVGKRITAPKKATFRKNTDVKN